MGRFTEDAAVIGGCGGVGLPLGVAPASRSLSVVSRRIEAVAVDRFYRKF
jgi:UDP-N-acetyl-D-mannosaminuronic acid dehydrogenase